MKKKSLKELVKKKVLQEPVHKKFLQELVLYIWIPAIVGLVLYIFWELQDFWLGSITLVAFSALYITLRLYLLHKKWWLLAIMPVIIAGAIGLFFASTPSATLSINNQAVTSSGISFTEGLVSVDPAPRSDGKYDRGTVVTLTASPALGYGWTSWVGTSNETSNPTTVNMSSTKQITVTFEPACSLVINNELVIGSLVDFTEGSVSVSPAPGADGKYAKDTVVTLTASPAPGYDWTSWSGTSNETTNPTTIMMSSTKQVTANFESRCSLILNNELVIGSIASFTEGTVSASPAPGADGKYAKDTVVMLTATPASGYDFKGWTGTSNDTSNPTTVTMSSDKQVTVTIDPRFFLIINNQLVTGAYINFTEGTVWIDPAPDADGKYAKGTVVKLTAWANPGYYFDHWEGNITHDIYIFITMDANTIIRAFFIRIY